MHLFWRRKKESSPNHSTNIPVDAPVNVPAVPLASRRLLSYRTASLHRIGARENQEDSFGFANAQDVTDIKNKGLLAVVADGMGGLTCGEQVSSRTVNLLLEEFSRMDREADMAVQLRDILLRTSQAVYSEFEGRGGSTAVACIFFQEACYFASVGDSGLYLKREDGICRLNREQNYCHELYLHMIRTKQLGAQKAESDPDAACLNQFIGIHTLHDVEFLRIPLPLQDGDTFLLCSDGVSGVLTDKELSLCLHAPSPQEACRQIDQKIQEKQLPYQDNYTALVITCGY